ncbi:MAG: tetratricopeptide repeat protein [Thermoanaerobaculia bacterium]
MAALLTFVASPAAAQVVAGPGAPELTPPVQEALLDLQDGWLRWSGALYGGDPERARAVLEEVRLTAGRLGMDRLPDLSAGALAQAVESAREGEGERAALALQAADLLDPGRPETAFAAADVARLSGDHAAAFAEQARGYLRLPWMGLEWTLALHDLLLWALASLLLAAGLFVALLMALRGRDLLRHLSGFFARRVGSVPAPLNAVLVAIALLWPLVLPAGLLWLTLYWSMLLWRYCGASARVVLALSWVLLAVAPVVIGLARERVDLSLSPPVRAMHAVEEDRLYGGLFTDLAVLPGALPGAPAVQHFLADFHVRLGQWEQARRLYEVVLEEEPENVAVLVNLGAYYFNRGDYGNAVALFQQATALGSARRLQNAAAHYDLSLAYAESYLFDEQREALLEARRIDDARVSRWLRRPEHRRIVTIEGGIARIPEIERALRREWSPPAEASPALQILRTARPAIVVLLVATLAAVASALLGGAPGGAPEAGRLAAFLVPGLPSAASGRYGRAFLALLIVAALALGALAAAGGLGYSLPWRYDPGSAFPLALVGLVLAVLGTARAVRVVRSGV